MTTLHDRLAELADEVPIGTAAPDLWQHGLRLHQRRRIGTAVIAAACCLLLVGLGLLDWQQRQAPVQPASGEAPLAIPDEFHEPSKWLPGTDGKPWDRLIAIMPADRGGWFGTTRGWVGISAKTGEYRFLDLPGDAGAGGGLALSPDGRYVAYWFTEPMPDAPAPPEWGDPAGGYTVYDVTLGETVQHETVESEEGVEVEPILWADDHTLALPYYLRVWLGEEAGVGGNDGRTRLHDIGSNEWTELPNLSPSSAGSGWVVEWGAPSKVRPADAPERVVRLRGGSGVPPVPNPDGTTVAGLLETRTNGGTRQTPNPIGIAELGDSDVVRFQQIPGETPYYGLLGWRDNETVLAWRWLSEEGPEAFTERGLYAVDIRTGDDELIADLGPELEFAAGLLHLPVVEQPEPQRPWNPWAKVTGGALIVLVGGLALLLWRRRVRP